MQIFAGPRIEEIVIHDLRSPLNVIGLALKMLERQSLPHTRELIEDLGLIRKSAGELERMLLCLVEASRMPSTRSTLAVETFDPRRMIAEILETHRSKPGAVPVELVLDETAPTEVSLDYERAKIAVGFTLDNACLSAGGKPVIVRLSGAPECCILRFETQSPSRDSTLSNGLKPDRFERILGSHGERRGLDLAIALEISTLFGGSARLETIAGVGTAAVLDWPVRLADDES